MSDVTIHATESEVEAAGMKPVAGRQDALDDQLIGQLVDRARAEGLNLTGAGRKRWMTRWKAALNAFEITFEGRLSAGR